MRLEREERRHRLFVQTNYERVAVYQDQIMYFRSDNQRVKLLFHNGKEMSTYMPLYSLEEELGPEFVKLKRGIIVNMQYVKVMGPSYCIMDDGVELEIGRNHRARVHRDYENYIYRELSKRSDRQEGSITECLNAGNLHIVYAEADTYATPAAGIAAFAYAPVSGCTNEGTVTNEDGDYGHAAGIAGYLSDSTVSGCTNTGKIVGPACTGGIAGYSQYCSVIESANAGTVAGSTSAARSTGGIIGELYEGNVTKCCNTAQVSGAGTSPTGGIVGWVYGDTSGIVSENWNSGAVTGNNAGGIAGQLGYMSDKCQIENCYNLGAISGTAYAGGICGFISSGHGDIQDSYSTGTVKLNGTGFADVAGICGNGVNSALSGCYALNESVTNSSGSSVERVRRWDHNNLSGNYAWNQMLLNGQTVNCTDASDPDGADVTSEQLPAV